MTNFTTPLQPNVKSNLTVFKIERYLQEINVCQVPHRYEVEIITSLKQNGRARTAIPIMLLLRLIMNGQSEWRIADIPSSKLSKAVIGGYLKPLPETPTQLRC